MADKRIKDLSTEITSFRTGDFIAVDGTSGTAKMSKNNVMKNSLGNVHLLDEVTSFAADAKILVDSETNGPGAMPKDSLLAINFNSIPYRSSYEMGSIYMTSSGLTYNNDSPYRARTQEDTLVKVKKGDTIGVKTGFQMYVAFTATGASPFTIVGWSTSYTCPSDGYVALLFRKGIGSDSPTTFEELMDAVYVRASRSELSSVNNLVSYSEKNWTAMRRTMYGKDGSSKSWKFYINKNTSCKIIPSKTVWSVENIGTPPRAKLAIRKILQDNTTKDVVVFYTNDIVPSFIDIIVPSDAEQIEIYFRADVGESVSFDVLVCEQKGLSLAPRNALFKSVNHRGYNTIAPENTLPAYKLSAKMGFGCVETDVQATSDGKFVCIHDPAVDRTSNGTGNVADMTLEELKALDFGSWKSESYAGTKIPTYEEFLICCRNLGLKVYVEVKSGLNYEKLVSITEGLGMIDAVTFISFSETALSGIKAVKDSVRLGYIVESISSGVISSASDLKTSNNEVFIDCKYSTLTDEMVGLAADAGIPIEVWTLNDIQAILGLNPYVSGVTSDLTIASNYIYPYELE